MSLALSLAQTDSTLHSSPADEDDFDASIEGILDLVLSDLDDVCGRCAPASEHNEHVEDQMSSLSQQLLVQQVPPALPPPSQTISQPNSQLPLPLPQAQTQASPVRCSDSTGYSRTNDSAESAESTLGSSDNDHVGHTEVHTKSDLTNDADAGIGMVRVEDAAAELGLSPRSRRLQRNRASASRSRRRRQQQLQSQAAQVVELESRLQSMSTELRRSEVRCDTLAAQNTFLQRMLLKLNLRVEGDVPLPLKDSLHATHGMLLPQHISQQTQAQHMERPSLSLEVPVVSEASTQNCDAADTSVCSKAPIASLQAEGSGRRGRKRPRGGAGGGSGGGARAVRPHTVALLSVCVLAVLGPASESATSHSHPPAARAVGSGRRLLSLPVPPPSPPATLMPTVAASVHSIAANMMHMPIHILFRDLCPLHHYHHQREERERSEYGGQQTGARAPLQAAAVTVALLLCAVVCATGLKAYLPLLSSRNTLIPICHGKPAASRGNAWTTAAFAVRNGIWDPASRLAALWWRGDDDMKLPG